MSSKLEAGNSDPLRQFVKGIRTQCKWPQLGILLIQNDIPEKVSDEQLEEFLQWLGALVEEAATFDMPLMREEVSDVAGTNVRWSRLRYRLYPLYVERLHVVPLTDEQHPSVLDGLQVITHGHWRLAADVFVPGERFYRTKSEAWRNFISSSAAQLAFAGGFAFNMLEVPPEPVRANKLDVRPLVLHALAQDGRACDRGDVRAQAAIANAFWQTFWATGALRSERGQTFPVAFLPCDRSWNGEFQPPFRERWVALHRRIFGRTSLMAYLCEAITKENALFFDPHANQFRLADDFDPSRYGVEFRDVALALFELRRTAFVDAYTGDNAKIFAAWKAHEEALGQGEAWSHSLAECATEHLLQNMQCPRSILEGFCVRIRRVVPYVGCAFLSEIVNETDRLRARGKIQNFDEEIIGATNSTFFLNFPEEYVTLHSAMNDPVALLVEDGRTHQVRTLRRAAFVRTTTGDCLISTNAGLKLLAEPLLFEGESVAAGPYRKADLSFGENRVGPLNFGAVIVGTSIVEAFEDSAAEIPMNGWVIGDSEAFGGPIDPEHAADVTVRVPCSGKEMQLRHAFAVGPLLVQNAKIVLLGTSKEEFQPIELSSEPRFDENAELPRTGLSEALRTCPKRGVPPTRFPYDWDRTRAPRSAIGVREDGTVVLVVVDGRADLAHSCGATLAELAQLMLNLGCRDAMNMDGGGSSVMFVNDPRAYGLKLRPDLRDGVVNLPSDLGGVERLLPVPLVICRPR